MWDLIVSVPDHCLSFYFTWLSTHVGLVCVKSAGLPLHWERAVYLVFHTCWVGLFEVSWVATLLGMSCLSGCLHVLG